LKVQRDGRNVTIEVRADGEGVVSHAGSALVALIADRSGLSAALSAGLAALRQRRSGHDPGRVVRDRHHRTRHPLSTPHALRT